MIFLFTDFGRDGPYLGQVRAVLHRRVPTVPVIDLFNDAPVFDARAGAYLLAAYTAEVAPGDVVMAVVDPGVGTARRAVALDTDGRWFVGPDNGLLAIVARRAGRARNWAIGWRPERFSSTFHGRDLFAPAAAELAMQGEGAAEALAFVPSPSLDRIAWPDDLRAVVSIDRYGNAVTGWRAVGLPLATRLVVNGREVSRAETFGEVQPGTAFWYENSSGLVEVAVNQGSAAAVLGITAGTPISIKAPV